ncbi:hypothetical protein [Nocardia abscessus]|nr:hypothetical protein [Nocardia abscessus]
MEHRPPAPAPARAGRPPPPPPARPPPAPPPGGAPPPPPPLCGLVAGQGR